MTATLPVPSSRRPAGDKSLSHSIESILKPSPVPQYFFQMEVSDKGVLTITVKGQFGGSDVDDFMNAINAKFRERRKILKVKFTAVEIVPIQNAAGRLLDLAVLCHEARKLPVYLKFPSNIYANLQKLTPREMKPPPFDRAKVRGIEMELTSPEPANVVTIHESERRVFNNPVVAALPPQPKVALSCVGKILSVTENTVTVSLFIEGEEVVGELASYQFPGKALAPGMVFEYRVLNQSAGTTLIKIDFRPRQQPSDDDLMDLDKQMGDLNPLPEAAA